MELQKKALIINSVCGVLSTGRICGELAKDLESQGFEVRIAYGRRSAVPGIYRKYALRIGTDADVALHGIATRLFDKHGLGSLSATKRFLKWADEYNPDLLWLHNIHGYYINYRMLFDWVKKRPGMKVKWTLHDCWAFTGHCAYFDFAGCDKWMTGCNDCPQKNVYPRSFLADGSKRNYESKKLSFTGVRDMTLITPSKWLKDLVGKSFLKDYPVEVVPNDINREIFKPTKGGLISAINPENKKMILGVASIWDKRKGLDDFILLSQKLADAGAGKDCLIVLVGLTKKQIRDLPSGIIGLERVASPGVLAQVYTAADVFFNPTREDNYPTVNLEAQYCQTPVVTYDTGGCRETLILENSRVVKDLPEAVAAITEITGI